ncbi:DMT family transporter [Gordonia humi]|uniref:Small multidrug resistance pump n=1 Tax=Gordonia humi TaxID=686429 RepID=A0A840F975_9ACTN|nr:SMR family transporter [Gordonia humi]MBB4136710.1 small multidrug resistance pump [Gordonia humi]
MKAWALLLAAIALELAGTLSLRASVDHKAWIAIVVVAYVGAFVLLGLALRTGMPIGVAYGAWGALGVAATAVLGWVIFDEALSALSIVGIALVMVGVVVVENGSHPPAENTVDEVSA